MLRFFYRAAGYVAGVVFLAVIVAATFDTAGVWNSERSSAPSHAARAERSPSLVVSASPEHVADLAGVDEWIAAEHARIEAENALRQELEAAAEAERRRALEPQAPSTSSGPRASAQGGSCAGDFDGCFKDCTIDHESRSSGVYTAVSPDGVYRGAYQYLGSTWRVVSANAGYGEWSDTPVDQVPPDVQDAVARFHYAHSGNQPWGGRC